MTTQDSNNCALVIGDGSTIKKTEGNTSAGDIHYPCSNVCEVKQSTMGRMQIKKKTI